MIYYILKGSIGIKVKKPQLGSLPVVVKTLFDGEVFGDKPWDISNFNSRTRDFDASTLEHTELLIIPREYVTGAILSISETNPQINEIIKILKLLLLFTVV